MEIETSDQLEERSLNVSAFLQCQNLGFVDEIRTQELLQKQ